MVKRMLIDATHSEETRVVVLNGNRLEEFDFETSTKKQLKGNIYLAKITRVEPSLQAAFVEYGGNRHGFLAFNEIHPDYYRIPIADREALIAEVASGDPDMPVGSGNGGSHGADGEESDPVDVVGGDEMEEVAPRRHRNFRNYKIQEVIARRQIMLVQVVKEERGTKGAALTTYLSLAGRYCVLMPNTPRGGGVSRKITSVADRKRLKVMLDDFDLPDGMAVIVRTAGMERSKAEIKRDYEYLLRLWDEIRETTLQSSAPALIHEEGSLVKRAIRDLYSRDIDEVLVEGEEGYKTAKTFMKMIVPSHAKRVQPYRDPTIPMLHRYQVETQLDAIHSPTCQLKSGGYIVINPTEALVAIDVNSGRATKERHIEETALKTNLEAADEIARQVRLRDLAGLIVIDFIDMEENRNNHAVERRLKEAMKNDRARIQLGRISPFGLLELSRQRLRPSLVEASTERCPHCSGTGVVRSTESTALYVLRAIEEEGIRARTAEIMVYVPTAVALYILNQKRSALAGIESRYAMQVQIGRDDALIPPDYRLERLRQRLPGEIVPIPAMPPPPPEDDDDDVVEDLADDEMENETGSASETGSESETDEADDAAPAAAGDGDTRRRGRRRRRRRRGEGRGDEARAPASEQTEDGQAVEAAEGEEPADGEAEAGADDAVRPGETEAEAAERRRRRRGKRGGRRRNRRPEGEAAVAAEAAPVDDAALPPADQELVDQPIPGLPAVVEAVAAPIPAEAVAEPEVAEQPKRPSRRRKPAAAEQPAPEAAAADAAPAEKPKRPSRRRKPAPEAEAVAVVTVPIAEAEPAPGAEPVPEPEPVPVPEPVPTPVLGPEPIAAAPAEPAAIEAPAEPEPPKPVEGVDVTLVDKPTENPKRGWWRKLVP